MKFIKGENKEVKIQITSTKADPFVIRNATYELIRVDTDEVETSGPANISNHEVSTLVEPLKKGTYVIFFTYEIALEKLKAPVAIEVE